MIVATTNELLTKFRGEVSDVESDVPLWTDTEIFEYVSEAADKVAKETDNLYRLVNVPVVALDPFVRLPKNVLHIREARVLSNGKMLQPAMYNELNCMIVSDYGISVSNVVIGHTGALAYFCRDYKPGSLLLVPAPVVGDTIELQCTVTQGTPITAGSNMPFDDSTDQRLMLTWMKVLAYEKQDADTSDMKRADRYRSIFNSEVKDRKSALHNYRRAPRPIQMEW